MRTLLTVLTAAVLANAANAAVPPPWVLDELQPLPVKAFEVDELVGPDSLVTTSKELVKVLDEIVQMTHKWEVGSKKTPRVHLEPDGKIVNVVGSMEAISAAEKLIESLRTLNERRRRQIQVACVIFTTSEGTGKAMLLPKDGDEPVKLTEREVVLTNSLIRTTKAVGNLDVLARPSMTLTHGQEGFFRVGQQFPEVVSKCENRDGTITQKVAYADVGLTHKLTATVQDGGGVKLTGSVSSSEVVKDKVRVTHKGEFATEVPVGGTAVARIPAVGSSGTEMYLMLTVTSVGPGKKAEPAKVVVSPYGSLPAITIPPVPAVDVPLPGIVPVGGQLLPPTKPSLGGVWEEMPKQGGVQFRFVAQNGQVLHPAVLVEMPLAPPPLPTAIPPVK